MVLLLVLPTIVAGLRMEVDGCLVSSSSRSSTFHCRSGTSNGRASSITSSTGADGSLPVEATVDSGTARQHLLKPAYTGQALEKMGYPSDLVKTWRRVGLLALFGKPPTNRTDATLAFVGVFEDALEQATGRDLLGSAGAPRFRQPGYVADIAQRLEWLVDAAGADGGIGPFRVLFLGAGPPTSRVQEIDGNAGLEALWTDISAPPGIERTYFVWGRDETYKPAKERRGENHVIAPPGQPHGGRIDWFEVDNSELVPSEMEQALRRAGIIFWGGMIFFIVRGKHAKSRLLRAGRRRDAATDRVLSMIRNINSPFSV